jgi:Tol biopolymer transport system component
MISLPNSSHRNTARFIRRCLSGIVAAWVAFTISGCASPIPVTSNPPGARVTANGQILGATPTQMTPEGSQPVTMEFRLNGYFTETVTVNPATAQQGVSVKLEPTTFTKNFDFMSTPADAAVTLDDQPIGTTPMAGYSVSFTRDNKFSDWKPRTLSVSKANYQAETFTLTSATDSVPKFELGLLRDDRTYNITAATPDGQELNAEVTLNGKPAGLTPLKLPISFRRAVKTAPWPKFDLGVEVPAKYKRVATTIDFARGTTIALRLDPVVEITTELVGPALSMTPTGVVLKAVRTPMIAVLSTRETAEIASELKAITDYKRKDLKDAPATRAEGLNSFCISPDGQNVIFSLTEHDDDGNLFSNLFIKRSDDAAGGVARLTDGSFWHSLPFIANDGSNYLVFVSNRFDRNKTDIYRVNLVDNRLSGGISRLTNDNRFNYSPTYGDSNRQLFYLSTEPNFPKAEAVVSSIRIDGSLPTQMSISALEINNAFPDKVFFVKTDNDTKKRQIYSVTADGKLETGLLSQEDFRKSNCFNPAVSADGTRILFVSDQGVDEQGRHNNDIYMSNSDGTNLHRLTQNGSDDIMPAWSPTEEGVVYFLSNRGGAYNVWRMKLSAGTK